MDIYYYIILNFNEIIIHIRSITLFLLLEAKAILKKKDRTEDEIWYLVRATKSFKYFKEINLYRKN